MYYDMTGQHQYRLLDGIAIIRPATLSDIQPLIPGASPLPTPITEDTSDAQGQDETREEEEA